MGRYVEESVGSHPETSRRRSVAISALVQWQICGPLAARAGISSHFRGKPRPIYSPEWAHETGRGSTGSLAEVQ